MRSKVLLVAVALLSCTKPDPAAEARQAGNALFQKGEYAQAAAEYERALGLDQAPASKAFETAAFAWLKAGEVDKAAATLERSIAGRDAAGQLEVYRNITGMYLQASRGADAEPYFKKILELEPKDTQAMGWLAEIASTRGGARDNLKAAVPAELDTALDWYAKVLEQKPDDVGVWVNRRIIYVKYADYYAGLKVQAEADAEANKADPETAGDFKRQAEQAQAKGDAMRTQLEEANARISALNAKKKAP